MLKGIGVLALALFIEVAFLAAVTGPAAPERVTRVEVGELEFAPAPGAPSALPQPEEPGMVLARQGRRPAHPVVR
jgi:hypothetical protein